MNRTVKYESYGLTKAGEIKEALAQVQEIISRPGKVKLTIVLDVEEN